ncbi:MAM and LDL-receptor class A domain-containing protein 1-like [Xiphias gladius]|uniref:MAM and LDL-receptor class A domain-containing protein 1-like n=1 Tax=Xiphias gladius TaxID=8245 RepID=UPI001A9956B6|nr:MAM and LDL-receptor class A domain-containing protein 1-like [Xiphias gladius]
MAPCTYVLAKTCSPTDALPMFTVVVVNEQNGNSSLPTVQQVTVDTGNIRVALLKRQTHRVAVNGVWRKLPLSLNNDTVNITSNPAAVVLGTSFGLSVSYDSAGAVHVTLPSTYSDEVCGLCGNFNHVKGDDFHKPDGTNAQNATDLAESWQTGQTTSSCETILVPHQCDPLEVDEYASEPYCGGLLSSTGPFADCQSVLGAESYFRGCVFSMCSTHGDPAVLCETLQLYTDICTEAGVAVPIWRNSTFCPLQCAENSHYNSCADGCPEVCSSLDLVGSCESCEERCECDSGFKLSGGKCVPAEDCGCWYNGKHFEKGTTFVEGECVQQCQCMGNNDLWCTTMQCANNEVCKVKEGVKNCFPFKPATCSVYGDPHYITFDRVAYDFQGGCSYTLTTTCGEESSVQFTVIGHNMHPPLQNFTRSKLEAVTLQVEDFYITLNQNGEVNVNNSHVRLPYFTSGTYGSLWVHMRNNFIILETTFGLRIMVDGQNRLFLQVDERYKYELCGLCGTYSGYQDDEFITPGGHNATESFEFGDSWRVLDNNECTAYPNDPRLCDYDEENEAYNECYAILGDAFKSCHEPVHPDIYLQSCVYDYCDTNGDKHTICESLKSYAAACQVAGVELPPWHTDTACADPQTTSTRPATPPPTSATPDLPFCPMKCDFEKNLCGWEQLIQDSFDWTRYSGPTPSEFTGPNQDHTTGAGFYIYIEGNGVNRGDSARILSSVCHYNGSLCLHFWYHMYGSATAMALNIYLLKDNKATRLWSMVNNQGPKWSPGNVDIRVSGPFQIIIEGIQGSNAQSNVAIDDVSIQFGSCSGIFPGLVSGTSLPSTTAEVLPSHPVCNLDCGFNSNLCSWNQMTTDAFDWTWQNGSTPTLMTGPSADHTGDGHYLYIEANSASLGDTARLISSECSDSGPQCLQFWYHMYGSADTMGIHVYLLQNRVADAFWWKRNDQGNMWHLAQVDIATTGTFQIIFEGRRGSNDQSDVAIDDVKLYRGHCHDLSGVTAQPPRPNLNTTAPVSVPGPTTAAPEPPVVNVTAQGPIMNATIPPLREAAINRRNDRSPASHPVCQMDCDFEQDLCEWSQLLADVFDWTRHSNSTPTTMTGPSSDHTTGDGHYLYIEANSASLGDTARLISSECSDSGPQCLQFWYHMYGSADTMGIHVYLLQNRVADAVWWRRNNQGNMWHLAQVDITTAGGFQIIIEGRRGSTEESDVAIDDVKLYHGRCSDLSGVVTTSPPKPAGHNTAPPSGPVPTTAAPESPLVNVTAQPPMANITIPPTVEAITDLLNKDSVTESPDEKPPQHPVCQLHCNFEQDLCQWSQLLADVFDWTRHSGSTPTMMTGPSSDHTTGDGHYLYIEANSASLGDTARLISSECSDSGPQCLQFWYHMYGSADTMGIHVYLLQNRVADAVWWRRNNQGNMWHLAQVDITTAGGFQIIIEGRRGSTEESDVAIDDVKLYHGRCSDLSGVVTTSPPKPAGHNTAPPSGPVPTTAAPESPLVNVTAQPPMANITIPPTVEAITDLLNKDSVTESPDEKPPQHPVCQLHCNFEQDLCQWSQLLADVFDWTRHSGSTPTMMTGPSSDHTTGDGHYLYIEANSASLGDTARLISSECSDSGPQCLQFWYHMYGSADTMGIHVYLIQDNKADVVWWRRNDQGNMWHLAQVDITTAGGFQVRHLLLWRRGSTEESDVAIDDVKLYHGRCSDLSGVVTTSPPKPAGHNTAPPSGPVPTTAAPESPLVNVTAQPPMANITIPPTVEAITDLLNKDSVTESPDEKPPQHPVCQLHCNFEQDLCQWSQLLADVFDWTRHSGSTPTMMTGPSSDHTTGDGHYLYIEANSASLGDTARLISSECSDSGPQCLQFWYHMYGSADTMGIHVYLLQNRVADAVWWRRNNQGNMWHLAQVDITTAGGFQIIIEGRRGSTEESDVAIDDVKLYHGRCSDLSGVVTTSPPKPAGHNTAPPSGPVPTTAAPESPLVNVTAQPPIANITIPPTVEAITDLLNKDSVTESPDEKPPQHPVCQLHCNFEQDLCQWSQLLADVFDWTRHSGSTPTMMTGPSSDHTTGDGHYLYIEANSASLGDTARLISSECSDSGPQCLQFWYHMYGSADTMGIHVYLIQDNKADVVWRKRNDQGNMWHLAQVDLTPIGAFQIIFEGRRGSSDQSDVAIDDITLHLGHCGDLAKPTTSAPKTLDPVVTAGPELPQANSSPATQPPKTTSSKPQPTLATALTTTTTTTTTAVPTDSDTQAPAKPSTTTQPPYTSNPDFPMITRPDVLTTARPQPPTTTTPQPQTTNRPQPPTTTTPQPQTTARPQPPTTTTPQPPTTTTPKPQPPTTTTPKPQPPTTTTPKPQPPTTTTPKPQPPTTTQPD